VVGSGRKRGRGVDFGCGWGVFGFGGCASGGAGEQRDEGEGSAAGRTDQGKHLIDPCQQSSPPGRSGGTGVGWLGCWDLWVGRRGRRGQGEREILDGHLIGEGVVLAGPFGDQGPQGRVGGEDPVVPVAVDPGRREDLGEAIYTENRTDPILDWDVAAETGGPFEFPLLSPTFSRVSTT